MIARDRRCCVRDNRFVFDEHEGKIDASCNRIAWSSTALRYDDESVMIFDEIKQNIAARVKCRSSTSQLAVKMTNFVEISQIRKF